MVTSTDVSLSLKNSTDSLIYLPIAFDVVASVENQNGVSAQIPLHFSQEATPQLFFFPRIHENFVAVQVFALGNCDDLGMIGTHREGTEIILF